MDMVIILNSDVFGKNVRYLRRKQKMSIFRLARHLELPVWTLYRIETGKLRSLEDLLVQWICKIFSVDMHTMIYMKLYE